MSDEELRVAFEECTLSPELFDHRHHVRVAWIYLRAHGPLEGVSRFCTSLRRYAGNLGKASIYHETVTWAFLFLIYERMQRNGAEDFEEFAASNTDLFSRPPILEHYYRPQTLASDFARRVFVMPDRGVA